MRRIFLGRHAQYEALVSDEDWEFLSGFSWSFGVSHPAGGLVYARRSVWVPGANYNRTVLMHHVVLERRAAEGDPTAIRPSKKHTADHGDGNSLNNQRRNLRWATHGEQMAKENRRGIRARPAEPPMWDEEIPY